MKGGVMISTILVVGGAWVLLSIPTVFVLGRLASADSRTPRPDEESL